MGGIGDDDNDKFESFDCGAGALEWMGMWVAVEKVLN